MISPAAVLALAWVAAVPDARPGPDALVIESDSLCPSADAVRDALAGLRPPSRDGEAGLRLAEPKRARPSEASALGGGGEGPRAWKPSQGFHVNDWPHTTVAISAREQFLLVSLGSRAASPREVAVGADCVARAATAAVIIATWLGDLPAEKVGSPVLRASQPTDAAAPPVAPAPGPAPTPVPSPAPMPVPSLHEIGLGALAAFGGGTVPGLRVEYVRHLRESRFGWQASLALTSPREAAVGGGTTRWMRVAASLAFHARHAGSRYFVAGDGGLAVAYTAAWGQDYATNQTDQSATVGLVAGLRGGIPWGRIRLWTDVHAFRWLYGQSVQIDADGGDSAKLSLPTWDLQWALGASYVF